MKRECDKIEATRATRPWPEIAADDAARQAKKNRAAALVARQELEVAEREAESLHVRSASLRQYLASEAGVVQAERVRPMRWKDGVRFLNCYEVELRMVFQIAFRIAFLMVSTYAATSR